VFLTACGCALGAPGTITLISPFTKPGYVSHVTTDTTAWLTFVEMLFNLPPLNARKRMGQHQQHDGFLQLHESALDDAATESSL
jgi:hypothetical protein